MVINELDAEFGLESDEEPIENIASYCGGTCSSWNLWLL
jgi:hypothetical protein